MTDRRELITALLAAATLPWLPGCKSHSSQPGSGQRNPGQAAKQPARHLTITGQALMEHPLCQMPYPGLREVMAELQRGDAVFTNLEVAIRTPQSGAPTRNNIFLHTAPPSVLDCLQAMGFHLLALSNNHAWDLHTAGVLATREAVLQAGFAAAGSGADIHQASAPAWLDDGSTALVSMACGKIPQGGAATASSAGINELRTDESGQLLSEDVERNLASLSVARQSGARVIAYLHNHLWGDDMARLKPWARSFAQQCVDAGADIFVSHGAPLLMGIEMYKGRPLLHGLGSLVFQSRTQDGHYPAEVWQSAIVQVTFDRQDNCQLEVVPVSLNEVADDPQQRQASRGRPRLASGQAAEQIIERMIRMSSALGTPLVRQGERAFYTV